MRLNSYWNPNYWGVVMGNYVQVADINLAVYPASEQNYYDLRELVKTEPYEISNVGFVDGVIHAIFRFNVKD